MKEILVFLANQPSSPDAREGLPFWIFWFLLCIIVLLVMFIFLRDKDLRRRINLFLFGAKQKMIKIRLQRSLAREKKKMSRTLQEIGRTVWEKSVPVQGGFRISDDIDRLQARVKNLGTEITAVDAKIEELQRISSETSQKFEDRLAGDLVEKKKLDEKALKMAAEKKFIEDELAFIRKDIRTADKGLRNADKEIQSANVNGRLTEEEKRGRRTTITEKIKALRGDKAQSETRSQELKPKRLRISHELKDLRESIGLYAKKIKTLSEEEKSELRDLQKEIREWKREKEKKQEMIKKLEDQKMPLFEELGLLVNSPRIEIGDLAFQYTQVDRHTKRIEDLEEQIRKLD